MISIVSKERTRVQFDTQIVSFARGLELYDAELDIVFEDIITAEFLRTMKSFYEAAEFKDENLRMKAQEIKSTDLALALSEAHHALMEPFHKKALKLKTLVPFV
jgi:hypothetical protein